MTLMVAVDHRAPDNLVENLLRAAAARSGRTGEAVHLLSVVPRERHAGFDPDVSLRDRVDPFSGGLLPLEPPKRTRERYAMTPELRDRQRTALRALANRHLTGVRHQEYVETGNDVAGSIVAAARRLQADSIMVGSPTHGLLHRALHGSVTADLIERAPVPVVVVGRGLISTAARS
jgi:nucleotide-binding universal stress UspA family protein